MRRSVAASSRVKVSSAPRASNVNPRRNDIQRSFANKGRPAARAPQPKGTLLVTPFSLQILRPRTYCTVQEADVVAKEVVTKEAAPVVQMSEEEKKKIQEEAKTLISVNSDRFQAADFAQDVNVPECRRALELFQSIGDKRGIYQASHTLGISQFMHEIFRQQQSSKYKECIAQDGDLPPFEMTEAVRDAFELQKSALQLAKQFANPLWCMHTIEHLSTCYTLVTNYTQSVKLLEEGLALAKKEKNAQFVSTFSMHLGDIYSRMKRYEEASQLLAEGLAIAEDNNLLLDVCTLTQHLAIHYERQELFPEAVEKWKEAYEQGVQLREPHIQYLCIRAIATNYLRLNRWYDCIEYAERGVEYCDSKTLEGFPKEDLYHLLAEANSQLGNNAKAEEWAQKLVDYGREKEDPVTEAQALIDMAMLLGAKGDHKGAVEKAQGVIEIADRVGNNQMRAAALKILALADMAKSMWDKAIRTLLHALEAAKQAKDTNIQADVQEQLAICHHNNGTYDQSLLHAHEAMQLFDSSGDPEGRLRCTCHVISTYKAQNKFKESHALTSAAVSQAQRLVQAGVLKQFPPELQKILILHGQSGIKYDINV